MPNRALFLCRAWMALEQDAHRLFVNFLDETKILTQKNRRTFWVRPLSFLLTKLS